MTAKRIRSRSRATDSSADRYSLSELADGVSRKIQGHHRDWSSTKTRARAAEVRKAALGFNGSSRKWALTMSASYLESR